MKRAYYMKKIIERIAKRHSFDVAAADGSGITIKTGEGFMPLSITAYRKNVVAVAHVKYDDYGDISYDPEVQFYMAGGEWYPISIEQPATVLQFASGGERVIGGYQEAVWFDGFGKPEKLIPGQQASIASFCTTWAKNLKWQGFDNTDVTVTRHGC